MVGKLDARKHVVPGEIPKDVSFDMHYEPSADHRGARKPAEKSSNIAIGQVCTEK